MKMHLEFILAIVLANPRNKSKIVSIVYVKIISISISLYNFGASKNNELIDRQRNYKKNRQSDFGCNIKYEPND